MSKSMIYVIYAEEAMSVKQVLELRNAIFDLAAKGSEEIYFHRHADDTLGGAPHLMVECSGGFLDEIKKLPQYGASNDIWPGTSTFRAGHGGPAAPNSWKRVLANDPADTWRLQDDIIRAAQAKGIQGEVLIRHIDADKGFISLLCPDDFVADIKKLERTGLVVTPKEAGKFRHPHAPSPHR